MGHAGTTLAVWGNREITLSCGVHGARCGNLLPPFLYPGMKDFPSLSHETRRKIVLAEQAGACNRCTLDKWLGFPMPLELEHKDGDRTNNDRANLEGLCPNCHSLTPTWRGRNNSKRVTDETLVEQLRLTGSRYKALVACGMAPKGNNYSRATRLVEEHGIPIRAARTSRGYRVMADADLDRVRSLRKEKMPWRAIAALVGFSRDTIARSLRESEATELHP